MTVATAYREPWTNGAKAYPEADSMADLWRGVRRKRSPLTVLVSHDTIGREPCAHCGIALADPYAVHPGEPPTHTDSLPYAWVDVDPRKRVAVARHYYCAWASTTMSALIALGRAMQG